LHAVILEWADFVRFSGGLTQIYHSRISLDYHRFHRRHRWINLAESARWIAQPQFSFHIDKTRNLAKDC